VRGRPSMERMTVMGSGWRRWPSVSTVLVELRWMDRRHWLLLLAAIACIAGLLLWIGEIDLGMEDSITQVGHSPAWKRHACGWRHLWTGTTTGTATAASSSLRHTSDTVAKPWRSAGIVPMSMNWHASKIHVAGHDLHVAGVNHRWSGSILHPRK
jgi:hypothetical protein